MTSTCDGWWLCRALGLLAVWLGHAATAPAGEVPVAVAANFAAAAGDLKQDFEQRTGHKLVLSTGSTGQLFLQIQQGAPFAVFLAADAARPARAVAEGLAVEGSAFTYALGTLVLYSAREPQLIDGAATLREPRFTKLALAQPELAPYGLAARQAMRKLGVYEALEPRLVRGKNVAQALSFVETGNAELGFVALAQVLDQPAASYWVVPAELYDPVRQDAVLLRAGRDNPGARAFLEYLRSPEARALIKKLGYGVESS